MANIWQVLADNVEDVTGPRILARGEVRLWRGFSAELGLPVCIYALYDEAEPNAVRYVGQTAQSLQSRLHGHVKEALGARCHSTRKREWIRAVVAAGRRVCCRPVAFTIWPAESDTIERRLIRVAREAAGDAITNTTDGGDRNNRGRTWKLSIATRARQSASARLRPPKSAEHRAKLSAALIGRPLSPEHRAKVAAAGAAVLRRINARRRRT